MAPDWTQIALNPETTAKDWYQVVRSLPMPVLLESGTRSAGRYDVVTAMPSCKIILEPDDPQQDHPFGFKLKTEFYNRKPGNIQSPLSENPLQVVDQLLDFFRPNSSQPFPDCFCGGALGYIAYEAGLPIQKVRPSAKERLGMPLFIWGIYEWTLLIDKASCESWLLISPDMEPGRQQDILQLITHAGSGHARQADTHQSKIVNYPANHFRSLEKPVSNMDFNEYAALFQKIRDYILAGDSYQVNLARRYSVLFDGDPFGLYESVLNTHQSPFSAYMDFNDFHILSFSPERFIRVENSTVTTQPIKGTRPRGKLKEEDEQLALDLLNSEKDQAENLMIVDLLRNDLGKCCEPGSIGVTELRKLKSFDNVHHLVSTVTGRLASDMTPLQLLWQCFPGGSITGAPKRRTMQIIEELEPCSREVYCGTLAYCSFNGLLDSSIAIRTIISANNRFYFWGGGGLVSDSIVEDEFRETEDKISFIQSALSDALSKKERNSE